MPERQDEMKHSVLTRHNLDFGKHYFLANRYTREDDTTKRRSFVGVAEVEVTRSVLGKISGDTWSALPLNWFGVGDERN